MLLLAVTEDGDWCVVNQMSVGVFLVKLVGLSVVDIVNKPFVPITCFIS